AKAANYEGAGTIEFIVDDNLNYYFLEMNTRLQVEHPITERVVGVDLVKEQIRIAEGNALPFAQEDLHQSGHAIECRIYAEDTDNNFMPNPGTITHITEPLGFGVRCDGYVYTGYTIPIYYDPMISKLIVWGNTRDEAIERMRRALFEYKISGVKTSIKFLEKIMDAPEFRKGGYNTHFIEDNMDFLMTDTECAYECENLALIAAFVEYTTQLREIEQTITPASTRHGSDWKEFGRRLAAWRL
ncbi:MAG TPA: biotin carboxylase, partial [Flavihumibacter sp.]|nr:biotin carboxylase [Flavihumibacter sp.]